MNDEKIIAALAELIERGQSISKSLHTHSELTANYNKETYQSENLGRYAPALKWQLDASNLLELRFGANSKFYTTFEKEMNKKIDVRGGRFFRELVANGTSILEHVRDALTSGYTEDLFYKREIEVFANLLDQASEFLVNGHRIAAAIYGRIVLETTVKEFAKQKGIEDKSFDQVIIKLRQNGIISKPFESSLRANYQLGSEAAHGEVTFQNYSDNQIKEYLSFIRDKVLTL